MVTVTHPDIRGRINVLEEPVGTGLELREAILAAICTLDASTCTTGLELHAVADPQHRHIDSEPCFIERRSIIIVDR